ncbi:MAG: hypothetical protein JST16_03565 [Bdellovibrionales bacterium]|nr:hypothetical protein [Bdellovibrionales bacterium]
MRVSGSLSIALVAWLGSPCSAWAIPKWVTQSAPTRSGNLLRITCDGTGPSIDTARRDALDHCRSSAADQLATSVKVRSSTIQTERDAALHQEISTAAEIKNFPCRTLREELEEAGSGIRLYLQCEFDLSKTETRDIEAPKSNPQEASARLQEATKPKSSSLGPLKIRSVASQLKRITISSIPMCDDLLVRGPSPRVIRCDTNPQPLVLQPNDEEVIVRAAGFIPQHLDANDLRGSPQDGIQIFLNSN